VVKIYYSTIAIRLCYEFTMKVVSLHQFDSHTYCGSTRSCPHMGNRTVRISQSLATIVSR